MVTRRILVVLFIGAFIPPVLAFGDLIILQELLRDIKIVEKESAEAKAVRLKWISEERTRIHGELARYEKELMEVKSIVPDAVRERVLSPAVTRERQREELRFNDWARNNDPARRFAIIRGEGMNALLRVLGPIAHYRKGRTNNAQAADIFPSLLPSHNIQGTDIAHYRLNPATSAGSKVVVRLNQLPLDLQWPPVITQQWPDERASIGKLRDVFVMKLNSGSGGTAYLDQADLLDQSLSLLQAKVQQRKWAVPHDLSIKGDKRIQIHRDLQDALRYLETVRATVERFKKVPSDYKVHRFVGGSIEDFLDFCYTHGMVFQEARPADEESYLKVYQQMQDYAHDVQFVEDWKNDLEQRIREMSSDDQKLVWMAAEQ